MNWLKKVITCFVLTDKNYNKKYAKSSLLDDIFKRLDCISIYIRLAYLSSLYDIMIYSAVPEMSMLLEICTQQFSLIVLLWYWVHEVSYKRGNRSTWVIIFFSIDILVITNNNASNFHILYIYTLPIKVYCKTLPQ